MTNSEIVRKALESADAAVWDKRYGKGLSVEYAQAVHAEIQEGLAALKSLQAELDAANLGWA